MPKKIWKFLSSMRFAVILLVVLAAACAGASLVEQGQTAAWYQDHYAPRIAGLILALHLDDAFHSWWFVLLAGFLCLNLLFCNLVHFPSVMRRMKNTPRRMPSAETATASAEGVRDAEALFAALRFPKPMRLDGGELYAEKNGTGRWGAWVCHLGILLLVAGFSLGQALGQEYTVYGVPGQSRPVGNTGLTVTIDDFRVETGESGSVEQYATDLTVTSPDGAVQSASTGVNAPARLFGWSLYQNSTGWAAQMDIFKDGEPLSSEVLCAGEYRPLLDKPEVIIYFREFYPDYAPVPGSAPVSQSQEVNNPAYLYMAYYRGEVLGMNVLLGDEPLTIDEYTVTFTNPQRYSLVQVKRDPWAVLAFLGGLVLMAGLFLAFYVQPAELWAVRDGDGWTVRGVCRKGGVLFREQFVRAAEAAGGRIAEPSEQVKPSEPPEQTTTPLEPPEQETEQTKENAGEGDSHAAS